MRTFTEEPKRIIFAEEQIKQMQGYDLVFDKNGNYRKDSPLIIKTLPKNFKIDYHPADPSDIGPFTNYNNYPLYVNPISIHDVAQGSIADCYLLAALAAIAFVRTDIVKFLISKVGTNNYLTRYHNYTIEDHVYVNADLGYTADRITADNATWVALYEKSYAFYRYQENTYSSLNYGYPPLFQLGFDNSYYSSNSPAIVPLIASALSNNLPVVGLTAYTIPAGVPLIGNHAYAITGVSSDGKFIYVYNPWGFDGVNADSNPNDGCVTLTLAQFQIYMSITIAATSFLMNFINPTPFPTISFSANPANVILGQPTTLSWTTTNATSVTINDITKSLNGSEIITPTENTLYTLIATGQGGTSNGIMNVSVANIHHHYHHHHHRNWK